MKHLFIVITGVVIAVAAVALIEGAIITWLWNWVAVSLFNAEPITYWLGVGIGLVLTVISSYFRNRGGKNND